MGGPAGNLAAGHTARERGGPGRPAEARKWRAWQRYATGGAGEENDGI
jgi:hypothetical protein